MDKVILITSGKGGTGKTVLTASIGCALARQDKKILLIDMNFGFRNLDIVLGLENMIFNNAFDVIKGKCSLKDAIVQNKMYKRLFVLLAAQTKDIKDVTKEEFISFIDGIKDEYDYILIDSPPGINITNLIPASDRALVVTTPEATSVRNNDKLISVIRKAGLFNITFIINKYNEKLISKYELMSVEDIKELLPVELIGIIPKDDEVYIHANQGESFIESGEAGVCIKRIASRIIGEDIPIRDFGKSKVHIKRFSNIFKKKSE